MKWKHLTGILLLLTISVGCGRVTPDYIDGHLKYVEFGVGETKAAKAFNWSSGDRVCVYSLRNGVITHKDTVIVSQANGNTCRIKALVDVDATKYFATYPMNAVTCETGEILNDGSLRIVYNGNYRDVSIMTCYAEVSDTDLWFKQRLSLLEIDNMLGTVNGTVTVRSSLPKTVDFSIGSFKSYYMPLSRLQEQVTVTFKTSNWTRTKTLDVEPGHIYRSSWTID